MLLICPQGLNLSIEANILIFQGAARPVGKPVGEFAAGQVLALPRVEIVATIGATGKMSMVTSTKNAVIRARIDAGLKGQAERVLAAMGLTVSDVLREVMVRVANDRELPFQVRTSLGGVREGKIGTITEQQFWARKRALQASDHARAASSTLQPEETLMIPSRMLRGAVPQWPQNAFAECEVPFG